MKVGIVGLGLIGGSLAKAYKENGAQVLACDMDRSVTDFAVLSGDVDGHLEADDLKDCDIVLLAVYPRAAIAYVKEHADCFGSKPLVVDCCGTKRMVCGELFPLAREKGFSYMGTHPMAGNQYSGYKYSRANLFHNAPMVLVPRDFDDVALLERAETLLKPAGFGSFSITTAENHDRLIAFTSQLAHVVSNAYIKSDAAGAHKGFSAGSYKDMTRVAWLNPPMWAELFMENRDNLLGELDNLIGKLEEYGACLREGDRDGLVKLLEEGRERKAKVDGR